MSKSAQRESNPHFRHGNAAGCRYIMGARESLIVLSKNKSTEWDSNPRHRITGAESSPLDDQCLSIAVFLKWDQRGSNPHRPG